MKGLLYIIVATVLTAFCLSSVQAQEKKAKSQLFMVHEDVVKPSMVAEYEKACLEFKARLQEHNVSGMSYKTVAYSDLRYVHISPIENMAALDEKPLAEMAEKMGKEGMKAMWDKFDVCYDEHRNYLIRLSHNLSYEPENASNNTDDMLYRQIAFYYVMPDKAADAKSISKEWKALFEKKNIDHAYRTYIGGMGLEMPLYVIVQPAKDAADFAARDAKVNKILGAEGEALMQKTMAITQRFEQKSGWMRPDLAYSPQERTAAR